MSYRVEYRAGRTGWYVPKSKVIANHELVHQPKHWVALPIEEHTIENTLRAVLDYFHLTTINYLFQVIDEDGAVVGSMEINGNGYANSL